MSSTDPTAGRTVGVIQARMGSGRLPGKVLLPLAGRSVLGWVVRAARQSGALDDLVIATSELPENDEIAAEADRLGVACHRGPEDDVLARFLGVLDELAADPADAVMRFTADCPLLDPVVIAQAVAVFRAMPGLDYVSTSLPHTLPRGLGVELASVRALRAIEPVAFGYHRAHVMTYFHEHAADFRVLGLTYPPYDGRLRATLDTAEDLRLIEAAVAKFGDAPIPHRELIDWLDRNPQVRALNSGVQQKSLSEA